MIRLRVFLNYIIATFVILGLLASVSGCSSTSQSFTAKTWHNTLARFNGYFNATQRMILGMDQLAQSHVDDYSKILEVYQYGDESQAKAVAGAMDEIIKKCSNVITNHSNSKWVDDSYLLLGKAQFFKGDYYAAIETFQYINTRYKKSKVRYEATIWILKSYIRMKKYQEAQSVLTFINSEGAYPEKLKGELAATAAWLYIHEKKYTLATERMEEAVKFTKKRNAKIRYTFILAQLYQVQNKFNKANPLYTKVVKMNAPYEMVFNARVNQAAGFNPNNKSAINQVIRDLKRMLRDDKNLTYTGRIYNELGNVYAKSGNRDLAIANYRLASANSANDGQTKVKSMLSLAEIYFAMPEYELAQAYFDSTAKTIQPEYPDYEKIKAKNAILTELISNLVMVRVQDSLQQNAREYLTDSVKYARKVDEIIRRQEEEKERKKAEARQQESLQEQQNQFNQQQPNLLLPNANASAWYFENKTQVSNGIAEFNRKYGKRELTDYWKYALIEKEIPSEKGVEGKDSVANEEEDEVPRAFAHIPTEKRGFYESLPITAADKKTSDEKVATALFDIGQIYQNKLTDFKEADAAYQQLLKKYPGNDKEEATLYNLYKMNKEQGKMEEAERYAQLLRSKYPESPYLQVISGGNEDGEKLGVDELDAAAGRFYKETYSLYLSGSYNQVLERCSSGVLKYPYSTFKPKMEYLHALALGRTKGRDAYVSAMESVSQNYPGTPEAKQADEILNTLKAPKTNVLGEADNGSSSEASFQNPLENEEHYYIIVLKNKSVNSLMVKARLSDYNSEVHGTEGLAVQSQIHNDGNTIIIVKSFGGKTAAMKYYKEFTDGLFFNSNGIVDTDNFVISASNFGGFIRASQSASYLNYFKKYYQ